MTTQAAVSSKPDFLSWLNSLPQDNGVVRLSTDKKFEHDETQYDAQYGHDPLNFDHGRGAIRLIKDTVGDLSGPALEIGCGTGALSLGLVEGSPYSHTLITDPSPHFVRITREKIARGGIDRDNVHFGILRGEDLACLPSNFFSLIILRSTLHHIVDVPAFLKEACRALRPGGILSFEEPCAEGYLVMGAVAQIMPLVAEKIGMPLDEKTEKKLEYFVATMRFRLRRDVDKTNDEDKHVFRVDQLMTQAREVGLEMSFIPNIAYSRYGTHLPGERSGAKSFIDFFKVYMKNCEGFGDTLTPLIEQGLSKYCSLIEEMGVAANGAYYHGIFVGRKK